MDKLLTIFKRRKVSLNARRARAGYFFVAPFIIGVLFIYLPILIDSIWYSLIDFNTKTFVGFDNYIEIIAGNSSGDFLASLGEGLQQLILEVPTVIIFSLFIAVVLNQKMLGRAVFRAIFFVPVIISTGLMISISGTSNMSSASSAAIDDGSGGGMVDVNSLTEVFKELAIGSEIVDFIVSLVNNIYNIINYSGVQMLIFLGGLQSISESIYEACRIDGATGWETFWKVTFPMISPMILVNAIYSIIDSFTRSTNKTISFIQQWPHFDEQAAMYWIYFIVVILILAAVAGVISSFIFYQRKD